MNIKNFLKEKKWKNWKKDQWLVVFLIGVLLLVIAIPVNGEKERLMNQNMIARQEEPIEGDDTRNVQKEGYADVLEQRLEEILRSIDGVGQVQVMITLQDNGESVVEKDKDTSYQVIEQGKEEGTETIEHQSKEVTVYENQTDEAAPFITKENAPEVEGVLVVAQGGANPAVVQNISEAIQALFGVEVHKIKIVKMNMQEGFN